LPLRFGCAILISVTTVATRPSILLSGSAAEIVAFCHALPIARRQMEILDTVAADAIRGRAVPCRRYAKAYLELLHILVESFGARLLPIAKEAARMAASTAVLSPSVQRLGAGAGITVCIVRQLRSMVVPSWRKQIRGLRLPVASGKALDINAVTSRQFEKFCRYVDRVGRADERRTSIHAVADIFDLNDTELARLFGVSRQAVRSWMNAGKVPGSRQAKAQTIFRIAQSLLRNLKPESVPGVVRRPTQWFGNESILAMIAKDRHQAVLDRLAVAFDWSVSA